MSAQQQPEQGRQTVIDTKFPLSWLIGCSAMIVFSMGGVAFKVSAMADTLGKIETKSDARDDKTMLIQQMVLISQGKLETVTANVNRNSTDIADMKRDIAEMQRSKTWAPK